MLIRFSGTAVSKRGGPPNASLPIPLTIYRRLPRSARYNRRCIPYSARIHAAVRNRNTVCMCVCVFSTGKNSGGGQCPFARGVPSFVFQKTKGRAITRYRVVGRTAVAADHRIFSGTMRPTLKTKGVLLAKPRSRGLLSPGFQPSVSSFFSFPFPLLSFFEPLLFFLSVFLFFLRLIPRR